MFKATKVSVFISFLAALQGCATNTAAPQLFSGENKNTAELSLVTGMVDPGVFLVKAAQTLQFCGVDDKMYESVMNHRYAKIYLEPGEHVLCVVVNVDGAPFLTQGYTKKIKFLAEKGKSYLVGFNTKIGSYSYWVREEGGAMVDVQMIAK